MCFMGGAEWLNGLIGGVASYATAKASKPNIPTSKVSAAPIAASYTAGKEALTAAKEAKRKAAAASGYQSTILTSALGDQSVVTTSKKTLLGG